MSCREREGWLENSEIAAVCDKIQVKAADELPGNDTGGRVLTKDSVDDGTTPSTAKAKTAKVAAKAKSPSSGTDSASKSPATKSPADNSTPTSTPAATGDPSTDRQTCQSAQQSAASCCANPDSCLDASERAQVQAANNTVNAASANPQQGLRDQCYQTKSIGDASTQANSAYSSACYRAHATCQQTCDSMASKYSGSSDASFFQSVSTTCAGLVAKLNNLGAQSTQGSIAGYSGNNCESLTNAQPSSMGGLGSNPLNSAQTANANDPYGCQTDPNNSACQSCTNNPTSAACQALAAAANTPQPTAGFQDAPAPVKDSSFNVGNSDGIVPQTQFGNYQPQTNTVNTVANNSGGAIPGAGGGGSGGATLGGGASGAPRGPSAGSPGFTTDIDQGFRSGGYSQPASTNDGGSGGGISGWINRKIFGKDKSRAPANVGLDLKQYLPGFPRDPNRRGAGLIPTAQLAPRGSDLFQRVHDRYQLLCRMGTLLDCPSERTNQE